MVYFAVTLRELRALIILCFSLEPEWAAAATEVKEQTKGKVKLAAVDATVNQMLASRYGIRGFPTIKIFQKGEDPVDYDGGRTRSDIVARALDLFSDNAPPPELLEVSLLHFFISKLLPCYTLCSFYRIVNQTAKLCCLCTVSWQK